MNKKRLFLIVIIIVAVYSFRMINIFEPEKMRDIQCKSTLIPDILKQRKQKKSSEDKNNAIAALEETSVYDTINKNKLPKIGESLSKKGVSKQKYNTPTPDELLKAQHNENLEEDIPATVTDMPAITEEQRRSEAQTETQSALSNIGEIDPLLPPETHNDEYELPAIPALIDAMPSELLNIEKNVEADSIIYSEVLVSPATGLTEQQEIGYEVREAPVDSEIPADRPDYKKEIENEF